MLDLASLFVFHQAGLPVGSAPYAPTSGKDLRSSAMRIYSILKTAAKVSVLCPQLFASKGLDGAWISLYSNIWGLGAARQPGGIWDLPGHPCLLPLLEMLPSLARMLSMRGEHSTAALSSVCDEAAQRSKSASVLTSIISCLGVKTHRALASPTLGLAILTSQPIWEILEAISSSLSGQEDEQPSCSMGTKTLPQPLASSLQGSQYHAPAHEVDVALSLAAFLAFSVDQIFCLSTALPSALISELDKVQPNADFLAALCKRVASTLKLLSAVHQGQDDSMQLSFLATFSGFVSLLSPTPVDDEGSMAISASDQISVLSHILSSPVWDVLMMDRFPGEMGEVSLITISLYQAVAVVEKGLILLSSVAGPSKGSAMDPAIFQQCRADIKEALLILSPPDEDIGASSSHPATSSSPSSSATTGPSTAMPLLRSSLVHLRAAVKSSCNSPFVPKSWELIKAELLLGEIEDVWGASSCCNAACTRLEGPCELEVKTLMCGGLCGARYCSRACQVQAWRAGHLSVCNTMREMKESSLQRRPVAGISPCQVYFDYDNPFPGLRIQIIIPCLPDLRIHQHLILDP